MSNQKISIIVPCYNQAQYLDECLHSVVNQSFTEWECIIVNDGSTDNTTEIAKNWQEKDNRFKYISILNGGVANARNRGIELAENEWILPLDADDKISPNYLLLASEYFQSNPKLIYGKAELFGEVNKPWNLETYSYRQLLASNIIYVSSLFKKSTWEKSRKFDSNLKAGLEDWDFWLEILNPEDKICYLPELVFHYRIKSGSRNKSFHDDQLKMESVKQYLFKKHQAKYEEELGDNINVISTLMKTERENAVLRKIVESKRSKLGFVLGNTFDNFMKMFKPTSRKKV